MRKYKRKNKRHPMFLKIALFSDARIFHLNSPINRKTYFDVFQIARNASNYFYEKLYNVFDTCILKYKSAQLKENFICFYLTLINKIRHKSKLLRLYRKI